MKLTDHVEHIRQLIDQSFRNRLGRMGINSGQLLPVDSIPVEYKIERIRIEGIREVFINETGSVNDAFEKLVEELTFTLFNRIAALKVMEAHTLHAEIVTRRDIHGGRSFSHLAWLEQNPSERSTEAEGLVLFFENQFEKLSQDIPLFSLSHPYHLLPTALELKTIVEAFNDVEHDQQVEDDIWKSDDILGWLYESYNNYKKIAHKESGDKTEYNKVSIQSQIYTPKWVVKFLVDNSLGKLYLEMYPDSKIKDKYKIANAPSERLRDLKPLDEIKLIDPAQGSANFLLYAFDLFYDLYIDQIEHYGAGFNESDIPKFIIERNLHGIDLDDRAIQLGQLGLYIKAKRKKRNVKIDHFNMVSSDFFLPPYTEVKHLFENENTLDPELEKIVIDLWDDLQQAYKFGSLIRLEEKFNSQIDALVAQFQRSQLNMFSEGNLANYQNFRYNFLDKLKFAVGQNVKKQGVTFLNTKTQDALNFLDLITQKYEIFLANPPYTDSSDFGPELRMFMDINYKTPYKFNSNLYAAFIKRSIELTSDDGLIAMIHPFSFMYIKSFEDVRKVILNKTNINILVDYGLDRVNVFDGGYASAPTFYILSRLKKANKTAFFRLVDDIQEKDKKEILLNSFDSFLNNSKDNYTFIIDQNELYKIEGYPFIYWISEAFREQFNNKKLKDVCDIISGIKTGNNEKCLRYWWELSPNTNLSKWSPYHKGGSFNKWYGNKWLMVNYANDFEVIKQQRSYNIPNEKYLFKTGVTYNGLGGKGVCGRIMHDQELFDMGSSSIFFKYEYYLLGLINSKVANYIINAFNPTVNTQPNDIERVPFAEPSDFQRKQIELLSKECIRIKKDLCCYSTSEPNFKFSPIISFQDQQIRNRIISFLNHENFELTKVLINESIINEIIYEIYNLNSDDITQIENKLGCSIGSLPIFDEAKNDFLDILDDSSQEIKCYVENLGSIVFEDFKLRELKEDFTTLYQANNGLEEFCIKNQVNPINVWYCFKDSNILPQARASELALEFITDNIKTLLEEDDDGIIPLVGLPGEEALAQRLEKHVINSGFTPAQYMQIEGLIGRSIPDYLENHFFKELSDHLNLFMYLPKTPFIWHLTSGEHQGFDAYISIYKWNRDSLFKIKSQYLSNRVQNLEYRQLQLHDVNTAQAQSEKEKIRLQLAEIDKFKVKIDELIAEGYDPKLDDGVGKNIAPLQKKGLLRAEVLKTSGGAKSQLEKYLNADW